MASIAPPSVISRTVPMKRTVPPAPVCASRNRSNSAAASKGSLWTRIIGALSKFGETVAGEEVCQTPLLIGDDWLGRRFPCKPVHQLESIRVELFLDEIDGGGWACLSGFAAQRFSGNSASVLSAVDKIGAGLVKLGAADERLEGLI